jgi:hypothetical protein
LPYGTNYPKQSITNSNFKISIQSTKHAFIKQKLGLIFKTLYPIFGNKKSPKIANIQALLKP